MKTVLITGASRGIGFATAKKFLAEGWRVIGTTTKKGQTIFDNANFKLIHLDYLKEETILSAVKEIEEAIDVLINNAGALFESEDIIKVDMEILRKTLEVNLIGQISFTEKILPMIKNGGQIINVGSRSAILNEELAEIDAPAYRISKVAINMYTKLLAKQLESRGIIVSSIDPGSVKTDMNTQAKKLPEEVAEEMYALATTKHESGQFWKSGKKRGW
ncbi:MAG: SDR family NAD(P)-dependent oxidoreductase [Patescibacteria group bacterium]